MDLFFLHILANFVSLKILNFFWCLHFLFDWSFTSWNILCFTSLVM